MTTIDIKMDAIYRASHDVLPARAERFAAQAAVLSDAMPPVLQQLAVAGNHPISGVLGVIADELVMHFHELVGTFNDSAIALDRIADDFVEADANASAWFRQHQEYVGDPDVAVVPTDSET